jgi:tetratricopeptide (TPR) repeat protein
MKAKVINRFIVKTLIFLLIIFWPLHVIGQEDSEKEKEEIKVLNQKGRNLLRGGRFEEATPYAERVLEMQEKRLGKDHLDVTNSLDHLAYLYRETGRYDEAESFYKRALSIREKSVGVNHPSFALSLHHLGNLYRLVGKYAQAEDLLKQALEIQERVIKKEHPDIALSFNTIGLLFISTGRYVEAEPLLKKALEIREKVLRKDHPDIARCINNLGWLYFLTGRYTEAEISYQKALEMRERESGKDHPDLAITLQNLGMLYTSTGRYNEAEEMHQRALGIREKAFRKDHPEIARSLNNLGWLYFKTGRYAEAELSYKKALEIRGGVSGKDHPDLATILHNLARLFNSTGRYSEAEEMHKRALEIREKVLKKDHPDIGASLNVLAWLYYTQGKYKEAEPLYIRALEIREKALGKDHPSLAATLNDMGLLYMQTGRYPESEQFHKRALEIWERVWGKQHPDIAISFNNLALLNVTMEKYDQAEINLRKSLEMREKVLGKEHPHIAMSLRNLAQLYATTGRHHESHQLFCKAMSIKEKERENVFSVLSEKQKLNYMADIKGNIDSFLTHTALDMQSNATAVTDTFNVWIRWKGAVLEAQGRYMDAMMYSGDPEIKRKFDELTQVRRNIARLQLSKPEEMTIQDYIKKLQELEKKKEYLETELSRLSKDFALEKIVGQADVKRINEILPMDSVYLDFAMIRQYDFKKRRRGAPRYFVFLLVPGVETIVKLIDIHRTGEVNRHIHTYLDEMRKVKQFEELPNVNVLRKEARALYELVMQPIEPYLKGKRKLFISPDGLLNLIPFEIFITEEGRYLMEDFVINYVTAGRDIVRFTDIAVARGGAIIIADPDYDIGVKAKDKVAGEMGVTKTIRGDVSRDAKGLKFIRLPDTKLEADNIEGILRQKYGEPIKNYQDMKALEEILFSVESPRILHLATHGYFLKDEEAKELLSQGFDLQEIEMTPGIGIENPMLRSGIVLAGVNTSLREGRDDGMVSAEKILGLRLKGTEIVVLSACETGVGDVKSGEGVFGLKRAFILSGARTVVMSLWSVPSRETTELMTRFYTLMAEGKTKAEALRQAKMDMMKGKGNPFYWGAFVLVGKPE